MFWEQGNTITGFNMSGGKLTNAVEVCPGTIYWAKINITGFQGMEVKLWFILVHRVWAWDLCPQGKGIHSWFIHVDGVWARDLCFLVYNFQIWFVRVWHGKCMSNVGFLKCAWYMLGVSSIVVLKR